MIRENLSARSYPRSFSLALAVFSLMLLVLVLSGCGSNNGEMSGDETGPMDDESPLQSNPYGNSDWMNRMASVIGERKLNEIIIPGTHESGTYGITKDSQTADDGNPNPCSKTVEEIQAKIPSWLPGADITCGKVQANWSKAQDKGTLTQLYSGIRYLDLRVYYSEEKQEYQVIHSLVSTGIDTVLNDIKSFYENYSWTSNEILILDINHTYNMTPERDRELVDKIRNKLIYQSGDKVNSSMMIYRCEDPAGMCIEPKDLTINTLWGLPGRVLLLYNTTDEALLDDFRFAWPNAGSANKIISRWPNTSSSLALMAKLHANAFHDAEAASVRKEGGFSVLQAIRTATGAEIKNSVTTALWNRYKGYEIDPVVDPIFGWEIVPGIDLEHIWRDNDWCTGCAMDLLEFGSQTNWQISSAGFMDNIAAPAANIIIVDNYHPSSWQFRSSWYGYVDAVKAMNSARFCEPWQGPFQVNKGRGSDNSNQRGDIAIGDINGNGKPDVVMFHLDGRSRDFYLDGPSKGYYQVGWDMDEKGNPSSWQDPTAVAVDLRGEAEGVGVALADINGNGKPELIVFYIEEGYFDRNPWAPKWRNHAYYRIGWDMDVTNGNPASWSDKIAVGGKWENQSKGAGIALYDINKNGKLDFLVFHVDENTGYYRIGWEMDENGTPSSWGDPVAAVSGGFERLSGAGVAIADVDGNGKPELLVFQVDEVERERKSAGYYRIGWDIKDDGKPPVFWTGKKVVSGEWRGETQGAGIAACDLNGNGLTDLVLFHRDSNFENWFSRTKENTSNYRIGLDISTDGLYPQSYCQ